MSLDILTYRDAIAEILVREHGYSQRKAADAAQAVCVMSAANGSSPEVAAAMCAAMARPAPAAASRPPAHRVDGHKDGRQRQIDAAAIDTVAKALRRVNR
jgi:hypothetical protein